MRHGLRGGANYRSNVLDIRAPVTVTLASKRIPLQQVLQLVPGAMIQFEKSSDEALTLEVGGHAFGFGMPVKVGDKFGLRISGLGPSRD